MLLFRKSYVSFLLGFLILSSCSDLTYVPVKTPAELAATRKQVIKDQLKADFEKQNMSYSPIAFDETDLIKPEPFFKLDSLYEMKYNLEQKNQKDAELENQIKIQQLIVANDTSKSYFLEHHVFGIKNSEDSIKNLDIFLSEIYVDQKNTVETMNIKRSARIQQKYATFFASFVFKKSFFAPYYLAEADELEFYNLYQIKLDQLPELEKDEFLDFMFSVMKVAKKNNSLDKQVLIQEFVRQYAQGNVRSYTNERFGKMEESFNENNELVHYFVEYHFTKKNENNELVKFDYEIYLDPYLQLIEMNNFVK